MSVYSVKGKGWRFDFTLKGQRYSKAWFRTKKEAKEAEAEMRKALLNPEPQAEIPTDTVFLDLVNLRLDHVKAYNGRRHYQDCVYMARRWTARWGHLKCSQISREVVEKFVLERSAVSPGVANKEIRYLRATFSFGMKKKLISGNPADGTEFLPLEKRLRYVPPPDDIEKVIAAADPDTRDYLETIRETLARVSEINRMTWNDVSFEARYVVLFTRKKKGGHLTPRKVPMTRKLYEILSRRYRERDQEKQWIFWHRYFSRKAGRWNEGPYGDRKKFMKTLCAKAGVRYFRFHALRHSGATIMENSNISITTIQKLLGHENRSTTEIYLHTLGNTERQAMDIFEQARRKSHTDSHMRQKKD